MSERETPKSEAANDRYLRACEREAEGEPLDASERELMRAYEAEHPAARRERELWSAAIEQLRGRGDDPRLDCDLDRLAGSILDQHRSAAQSDAPSRAARTWLASALALAAGVTLAVLAARWLAQDDAALDRSSTAEREQPSEQSPKSGDELAAVDREADSSSARPMDAKAVLTLIAGSVATDDTPAITPGRTLAPGARLQAALDSQACLRWQDPFALVCVDAGAKVELLADELSSERRLRLDSGRLVAVLDPLAPGQRFVVETSAGSVTAIGTVFVVEVGEVGIEAAVLEGVVEVRRDDAEPQRLSAGEAIDLDPAGAGVTAMSERSRERASFVIALSGLWRVPVERLGQLDLTEPTSTPVQLDEHELTAAPVALLAPSGQHRLGEGERAVELELQAGERLEATLPSPRVRGESSSSRKTSGSSAAELAELAQRNRMARNFPETVRLYRELIDRFPDSREAAIAPMRLGDLLLTMGDAEGALAAYDLYLEPGGSLAVAPEARFGRIKALRALGRSEAEREAIEEFLREHPDDYRCPELARALDEPAP